MADNVLGSIRIEISGDASQLEASLKSAQRVAQTAAANMNEAVQSLGPAAKAGNQVAIDALKQYERELQQAQKELRQMQIASDASSAAQSKGAAATKTATEAHHAAVSEIQATSGALRVLEGSGGLRAAERFLATTLGLGGALQSIFPIVGAIAFAEMLVKMGEHFEKLMKGSKDASEAIKIAFTELNNQTRLANDELQLTNDKLTDEIAKIEKHPNSGIKLALDEAAIAADQLEASLNKDIVALETLLKKNHVGGFRSLLGEASTSDIDEEAKLFRARVAKAAENGNTGIHAAAQVTSIGGVNLFSDETLQAQKRAAQTGMNTALTKLYADELVRLNHELRVSESTPGMGDTGARSEELRGLIASYESQQKSIGLKSDNADLQGDKEAAQRKSDAQKKASEEYKRHTQEMGQADQLALAELKSNHQVTIGEEIKFWQQRLAVEAGNTERYREITMKLGTLNQERDKLITSIAKHGATVMEAEARKAEKQKAKFTELALDSEALANRIAADMVKARERAQENQAMRTAAGAEGAAEGRKLANERAYGLEVVHTLQKQVQHMRELAAIDLEKSNARIAELEALQKIAEAAGDETKAAQYSLQLERERAAVKNQQYQAETQILQVQKDASLYAKVARIGQNIPGQLGGALAGGLTSGSPGKAIGQEIRGALQGIGHQILGTVFQSAIQHLIVSLGLNTLANTVLQALFGVQQGSTATLIASQAANTAAIVANTTALGVHAATGAAGAAAGVAGKVAGGVGNAASGGILSGVISGVISAAGSLVGAFLIIRAIHGTTAEVRALRRSGVKTGGDGISGSSNDKPAQDGYVHSLAKIFGADAVRVNVVAISPLALSNGVFGLIGNLFGFADGGRPPVGRASIVGERGPELFVPDQAGRIIPNHMLAGGAGLSLPSASASGGGISIGSITAHGVNNPREFVREVARQLPAYLKSTNPKYSPASR